jgi:DNA polymerase-3 subunit alpha
MPSGRAGQDGLPGPQHDVDDLAALRWIGKDLNWLYSLPLDDPRVYALLQAVDVTGVFQFEGRAQRYVCSMIKPEKFSEIMDCGALCRPGPLHNGAAKMYGEIKQGGKIATARTRCWDLSWPTQYQIVYQEQIMEIARVIGGFDDGVGEIRTIIAKKEGEQAFAKGASASWRRADAPQAVPAVPADERRPRENTDSGTA